MRAPIAKRGALPPSSIGDPVFGLGRRHSGVRTPSERRKKLPVPKFIWVTFGILAYLSSVFAIFNLLAPKGLEGIPLEVWWVAGGAWLVYGFTEPRRPSRDFERAIGNGDSR